MPYEVLLLEVSYGPLVHITLKTRLDDAMVVQNISPLLNNRGHKQIVEIIFHFCQDFPIVFNTNPILTYASHWFD